MSETEQEIVPIFFHDTKPTAPYNCELHICVDKVQYCLDAGNVVTLGPCKNAGKFPKHIKAVWQYPHATELVLLNPSPWPDMTG